MKAPRKIKGGGKKKKASSRSAAPREVGKKKRSSSPRRKKKKKKKRKADAHVLCADEGTFRGKEKHAGKGIILLP